jgi:O-antigen/teichoic acid export membrane protein
MAMIAVSINLTLNVLLIKKYGVIGAAIANMATQFFTSVYQIILAKRIFGFRTDYNLILRLIAFVMLVAAASLLINRISIFWLYSFGLYLLFAALLSFALGLMKVKSVWGIVSSDN